MDTAKEWRLHAVYHVATLPGEQRHDPVRRPLTSGSTIQDLCVHPQDRDCVRSGQLE